MQPPNPPAPLYAERVALGPTYRVIFDQPLLPGPATLPNYEVSYNNRDYDVTGAVIVADRIDLTGPGKLGFTPPNGITYHAAPPELFGLTGEPVAPFDKIPFV